MSDFAFICWELKRRKPLSIHGGYPCIGYPQADKLVPAFKKVGADVQIFEFCDYADLDFANHPEKDQPEPFKKIGQELTSDKVLIEWDGITSWRDYKNIFGWNKEIYILPHNSVIFGGYQTGDGEARIREEAVKGATKIIFQLQWEIDWWKNLECDKFELVYSPTRTGIKFDKMESRKKLGITTKYVLIAWGNYTDKQNEELIPWIAEWKDTSLLFVGSGNEQALVDIAKKYNIINNVFFSPHGISDVDADLWFSASDLCSYPRTGAGTSTPTHVFGQGLGMVTIPLKMYHELATLGGLITSNNLKETTRELLLNEE